MKSDKSSKSFWSTQLTSATRLWRARDGEVALVTTSDGKGFSFSATHAITAGIAFTTRIDAWTIGAGEFSIRGRGELIDYRVTALMAFAESRTSEATGAFLDFDVSAAACSLENKPTPPSPLIGLEDQDGMTKALNELHEGVERIQRFFGPLDLRSFGEMAIWLIRKGDGVGLHVNEIGAIFAAFIFGHREFAQSLLGDFEARWKSRAREQPGDQRVLNVLGIAQEEVSRIRLILS